MLAAAAITAASAATARLGGPVQGHPVAPTVLQRRPAPGPGRRRSGPIDCAVAQAAARRGAPCQIAARGAGLRARVMVARRSRYWPLGAAVFKGGKSKSHAGARLSELRRRALTSDLGPTQAEFNGATGNGTSTLGFNSDLPRRCRCAPLLGTRGPRRSGCVSESVHGTTQPNEVSWP
jgi:hypothetical protein